MLDAACPGQVFTSPTPDQMIEAAEAVETGAGVAKGELPHRSVLKLIFAGAIAGAFVLGLPMALAIIWLLK